MKIVNKSKLFYWRGVKLVLFLSTGCLLQTAPASFRLADGNRGATNL